MSKCIFTILAASTLALFSLQSFAIAPGAGQAQIRNNAQTMQQNKQHMQQMQRKQQQMIHQQKQPQQRQQR